MLKIKLRAFWKNLIFDFWNFRALRAVPNLNFDFKLKSRRLLYRIIIKMGKKVISLEKNRRDGNRNRKHQSSLYKDTNHSSPNSKSSDTAFYFEDNSEITVSMPQPKNPVIRKAEAIFMLSAIDYPSEVKYRER